MLSPKADTAIAEIPEGGLLPGVVVGTHHVRFLRDGADAFPAMLAAIRAAKSEILLEMYWFGADRVGHRFLDALVERAKAGVRVALVFDAIGSFETPWSFWRPLRDAGAEVYEFSPLWPLRRLFRARRLAFRDHRKILVVDGEIGFAGGINIGEPWDPPDHPERAFRDDALELRGPAVKALRAACLETLGRCGSKTLDKIADRADDIDPLVRVLTNRVGKRADRTIRRGYLAGIRRAHHSIDIASAYFLPGPLFLHAIRSAARRGVRVRVMVPEHSDVWIVSMAMSSILGRMLTDGIEVYMFSPRVLHSKTAVFDRQYTFIGSHNLDALSLSYNLECDVVVSSPEFGGLVLGAFERDLTDARKLDTESWEKRPMFLRFLAWLAALFRAFL